MHMRLFHEELGVKSDGPSTVFEDNVACISLAHGSQQSKRAKHYQLKVHFLNEKFNNGTFAFEKVGTADQLGDALTKSLPSTRQVIKSASIPGAPHTNHSRMP